MESIFYTETEQAYQREAQEFFQTEIVPIIAPMDRDNEYPFEALRKLAGKRYIGVRFPSPHGGGGQGPPL